MNHDPCATSAPTGPGAKTECQKTETAERPRARSVYRPHVDIVETADAVLLTADLPGVTENDVDVMLDKDVLTLRARVEPPHYEGYVPAALEYGVGDWERAFTVSNEIDRGRIEASVKDGVLRVRLPKSPVATTRRIAVTAG